MTITTVIVSKKGWVVIPKKIRERYGIEPGDELAVVDYAETIVLVPKKGDPIERLRGMVKGGPSLTQELLEDRRLEREREERKYQRWVEKTKERSS